MRRNVFGLFVVLFLILISSSVVIGDVTSFSNINFKVMTYNIRDGCGYDEECGDHINDLIEVINTKSPDILVIQEGNTYPKIRTAYTLLKNKLTDYESKADGLLGRGTFVKKSFGSISDFKASTYDTKGPSTGANPERYYTRAEVTLKSGPIIVVYNTHLFPVPLLLDAQSKNKKQCVDSKVSRPSVDSNKEQQDFSTTEKQAAELAGIVAKETLPVIVMGDMNAESDHLSSLSSSLTEVELLPKQPKTFPIKPYCANTATYGFQDWYQDLDHIFYNGFTASYGTVVTTSPAHLASDHYPVVAALSIDPSKIKKDPCGNAKIAIIGASNDVDLAGRYPSLIRGTCPGSTVLDYADEGKSIQEQESEQLPKALNGNPDVLIIDPSGNTCAKNQNVDQDIDALKSVIQKAGTASINQIVVLTISPRHLIGDTEISYQACITGFNAKIEEPNALAEKVKVVNIYPPLLKSGSGILCDHCSGPDTENEFKHWDPSGHQLVAKQILTEVFGYNGLLSTGATSITTGSGSAGIAPIAGQQTIATVSIDQGCAINQRCKDIDTAWNVFGGVLGLHSGQVWVPVKNTWMAFNDAYGAKQTAVQAAPTKGGGKSGGSSGSGVIECATASTDMSNQQKALLDTIAYAEGTTSCSIRANVPSYNIMLGCRIIRDLSGHPRKTGEMPVGGFPFGTEGKTSTAAGRYQFLYCSRKSCDYFFLKGFFPVEQDKEAWNRVEKKHGVSLNQIKSAGVDVEKWDPLWDKLSLEWASIRDNSMGKSHYSQGSGKSHETLTNAYNLCLNYYTNSGTGSNKFNVNSGNAEGSPISDEPSSELTPTTPGGPVADQAPTTSSSLKVLVIGDSHTVGSYGSNLHQLLKSTGAKVRSYAVVSTTAKQWADNNYKGYSSMKFIDEKGVSSFSVEKKGLAPLKTEFQPNIIIITLGTNMIDGSRHLSEAKTLAEMAAYGATCYWVGPPKTTATDLKDQLVPFINKLEKMVEPFCTFINSVPLSDADKLSKDGIHYTPAGGKEWATNAFNKLNLGEAKE